MSAFMIIGWIDALWPVVAAAAAFVVALVAGGWAVASMADDFMSAVTR